MCRYTHIYKQQECYPYYRGGMSNNSIKKNLNYDKKITIPDNDNYTSSITNIHILDESIAK